MFQNQITGTKARTLRDAGSRTAKQVSHQILQYLVRNPDAQDTLEGILQWWLLEQQIRNSATTVREALEWLISKDLVRTRQGADMRTYFRVNEAKYEDISALLGSNDSERTGPEADLTDVEFP